MGTAEVNREYLCPYVESTTWEDLGIKTDINASKLTVTFPIADNAADQKDQLWANPQLNLSKPNTTEKVNFAFTHITSQVNLYAGVETDAADRTPGAWTDATTEIEIKSIEFKNLSSSMTYSYALPSSTPTVTAGSEKQDVILTSSDFIEAASKINKSNYGSKTSGEWTKLNAVSSTMFLVPETLGKAIVTYTVTTEDDNLTDGKSVITNTVTCDLSGITMEAQKVYNLQFLIGMTSVKVSASVADWDSSTAVDEQINAPVVNYQDYLYNGYSITVKSEDETKGTVSSTLSGSELTLTATPTNSGYYALDKWVDEDNNEVTTIPVDLSSPVITKDKTYTAKFYDKRFSVSATKKVLFTKGNLYYSSTDDAYHLESSQTAYPTTWDAYHVGHFYWSKTASVAYAETYADSTAIGDKFFCGEDNKMTVDGQDNLYCLSSTEWEYLLSSTDDGGRGDGDSKFKHGVTVGTATNCLVIAPDGYTGTIASSYDAAAWATAEASGLVCLPAAGFRDGSSIGYGGSLGSYWSSTPGKSVKRYAYYINFIDSNVYPSYGNYRYYGCSVRLVWSASN